MSDASITTLSRQSGLLQAAQVIANNIANSSTPGYKSEGVIFSEYVTAGSGSAPSLSMGTLSGYSTDFSAGSLRTTGGTYDFAISGDGYFQVQTPAGERLTRAGMFQTDIDGQLTDINGNPVTDDGGSPISIPQDVGEIRVAKDGTISADGEILAKLGVFTPNGRVERAGANLWTSVEGSVAVEEPVILQGMVEQSNVSPVQEFAKLITAQRMFEAGQQLGDNEHERLTSLIEAIRQQG